MDRAQTAALPQILSDYTPHTFAYTCRSDLEAHGQPPFPSLEDWVKIFYDSINSFVKVAGADPSLQPAERAACAAKFATSYRSALDTLMNEVPSFSVKEKDAKVNCLELCRLR